MNKKHQLLAFDKPEASPYKLEAEVDVSPAGLRVRYVLGGQLEGLQLAPPAAPGPRDELWKFSCFEFFIQEQGSKAYEEWNFSPSSTWAHYAFSEYRKRRPEFVPEGPIVTISCRREDTKLQLEALIPWPQVGSATRDFRYGVAAVLQATDGSLSYWALSHAAERPDFHIADSMVANCRRP